MWLLLTFLCLTHTTWSSCLCAAQGASQPCRVMFSNTAASSSSSPPPGLHHTATRQHYPPPPPPLWEPRPASSTPIPVSLFTYFQMLRWSFGLQDGDYVLLFEDRKLLFRSIVPVCVRKPELTLEGLYGSVYHHTLVFPTL